jgi:hypothetical protein
MASDADGVQEERTEQVKLVATNRPGGIDHIYANNVVVGITAYDLVIWFSKLVRLPQHSPGDEPTNQVEHIASVTLAWAEAKALRDMLSDTIAKLEKLNGEINPAPKIPVNLKAPLEAIEARPPD